MANEEYKPNLPLRAEVAKDDVIILEARKVARLHTKTLRLAEDYYSSVLEALCGKQVWQILDALAMVQEELKSRKAPVVPEDFDQVKRFVFAELDRNMNNGYRR